MFCDLCFCVFCFRIFGFDFLILDCLVLEFFVLEFDSARGARLSMLQLTEARDHSGVARFIR